MLDEVSNNNIIKIIYDYQEQTNMIDEKTRKTLKELYDFENKIEQDIYNLLNIFICDKNNIDKVISKLEEYKEKVKIEISLLSEKYYRSGFKTGMIIVIDGIK